MNKILEDFTEEKRGTMCYNCQHVFCETCVRGLALEALEAQKAEIVEMIEGMKKIEEKDKEITFKLEVGRERKEGYNQALQDAITNIKKLS